MTLNELLDEVGISEEVEIDDGEFEVLVENETGVRVPVKEVRFDPAQEKFVLEV